MKMNVIEKKLYMIKVEKKEKNIYKKKEMVKYRDRERKRESEREREKREG